jgi:hypothetical protein
MKTYLITMQLEVFPRDNAYLTTEAGPFNNMIPTRFSEGYKRGSDETKRQSELENWVPTTED